MRRPYFWCWKFVGWEECIICEAFIVTTPLPLPPVSVIVILFPATIWVTPVLLIVGVPPPVVDIPVPATILVIAEPPTVVLSYLIAPSCEIAHQHGFPCGFPVVEVSPSNISEDPSLTPKNVIVSSAIILGAVRTKQPDNSTVRSPPVVTLYIQLQVWSLGATPP